MATPVIVVIGGTGKQGGVFEALLASGKFTVRVVTRDPVGAAAKALERWSTISDCRPCTLSRSA